MEGTCIYCGSGTSKLELLEAPNGRTAKVCPDCKEEHYDENQSLNTATEQDEDLRTDGGRDRLCHVLERIEEHQDRQADALEALAEQQEIQNAVLFELVRELDRSNSIAMKGIPDEASRPKGKATAVQDGVLYLAENVDVDEARRWADE